MSPSRRKNGERDQGRQENLAAAGENCEVDFVGYRLGCSNEAAFWAAVLLTGGLAYLVARWSETFGGVRQRIQRSIHKIQSTWGSEGQAKLVEHKGQRFLLQDGKLHPVPEFPESFGVELQRALEDVASGVAPAGPSCPRPKLLACYGRNEMQLELKSPGQLVWEEMWHPYFVFQYFSVAIWVATGYVSYSMVILGITWMAISAEVYNSWSQSRRLAAMTKQGSVVRCLIPGATRSASSLRFASEDVPSADLTPGDVVAVVAGMQVPCDMMILSGAVLVDEAMLTGESVPVRKTTWHGREPFDPIKHMDSMLSGGTAVLQVSGTTDGEPVLAMVARTGFNSAKGRLVKSMMYPKQLEDSFESDTFVFIALMSCMALVMYLVSVVAFVKYHYPTGVILLKFLDMVTVAVPPALPASMQVALALSIWRLQKFRIHVIEARRIIMAGALDAVAFDKTGTLTESSLKLESLWLWHEGTGSLVQEIKGFKTSFEIYEPSSQPSPGRNVSHNIYSVPSLTEVVDASEVPVSNDSQFQFPFKRQTKKLEHEPLVPQDNLGSSEPANDVPRDNRAVEEATPYEQSASGSPPAWELVMAICHGLAVLDEKICGDPLEETLFTYTGWQLLPGDGAMHPPGQPGRVHSVLKRYPFTSEDMRSTAIVELPCGSRKVLCKGSPEKLADVCGHGNLPREVAERLELLMAQGARCIGLASRDLKGGESPEDPREKIEAGMQLIGIVAMSAPLKPDSKSTISILQEADIRTLIVTGDHMATAVHIARQVGIFPAELPVLSIEAHSGRSMDVVMAGPFPGLVMRLLPPEGTPHSDSAATTAGQLELLQMAMHGSAALAATGAALAVAKEKSWHEALSVMIECGGVFARMLPNAKANLISAISRPYDELDSMDREELMESRRVGFVGDGANDIMALREAFVSLSLCEAEASIAAPLTSKEQSPYGIITAMSEGRCALACSYELVRYIVAYAYIQVLGLNILYFLARDVGGFQYLIQDLLFVTMTSALMGYTGPKRRLSAERPPSRLLTAEVYSAVAVQVFMVTVFLTLTLEILKAQEPKFFAQESSKKKSPEGNVVFIMSLAQLVVAGIMSNRSTPFRRAAITNPLLIIALTAQVSFVVALLCLPGGPDCWFTWEFAELVAMPLSVRVRLGVAILAYAASELFADWAIRKLLRCCPVPKENLYEQKLT